MYRRRTTKKRTYKKKRMMRIPRNPALGYLRCKQTHPFQYTVQAGQQAVETPYSFAFALANCPQSPTFHDLFDSYRIRGVKVKAMPLTNSSPGANNVYTMLSSIDYDDDTHATVNQLINRANVRTNIISPNGGHRQTFQWSVVPRYQTMVYETATGTGYTQGAKKAWLNTQDAKVPHFGLKIVWDTDTLLNSPVIWQFYVTYDLEFKSIKSSD